MWLWPLGWTVLMVVLLAVFLVTAKGEDYMAGGLVIGFTVGTAILAWGLYGLGHLVAWLL